MSSKRSPVTRVDGDEPIAEPFDPENDGGVDTLVAVARMYYEQELSQQEIARKLGKSRPTISRMLAAARRQGIVTIDIRDPFDRAPALERDLIEKFGLRAARVVVTPKGESGRTDRLGQAAATYLQSVLVDDVTIGVSNGRTLAATARYLRPERALRLRVVQIIGALGNDEPGIDGPDIARALASAYDTDCRYLHVPLLVAAPEIRQTLVRDHNISQTLEIGAQADIALIGVGVVDPGDRSPIFEGYLSPAQIADLREAGAVGHICGEFYGLDGQRSPVDINDRTISIGLDSLKKIPSVIAVAGGASKAEAIAAAIHGGYLNTLITDDRAADRILEMDT